MTSFEGAGYTKDTKFKVLLDCDELKRGDIVTLYEDDGTTWPYFTTEDGRTGEVVLPGVALDVKEEELEVYEEPKKLTPFVNAGYTKDTKFKVLVDYDDFVIGDTVTLYADNGSVCLIFKTQDGRSGAMYLPSTATEEELEVYEEPKKLTPFEQAGYTKDTKFRVLIEYGKLREGDIVTIHDDDGSDCPWFTTEDGLVRHALLLPDTPHITLQVLEVIESSLKDVYKPCKDLKRCVPEKHLNLGVPLQVTQGSPLRDINDNLNSIPKSYSINYSKTITINYEVKT